MAIGLLFGYATAITLKEVKLRLISVIAHALVKKQVVSIYLGDKDFLSNPNNMDHIVFVKSCERADLIIVSDPGRIKRRCRNKLIFVTNYNGFKRSPVVIGALFWQKGRPVLVFKGSNLRRRHIRLPKEMNKYVD